jgi:transcriptional enhancer factor
MQRRKYSSNGRLYGRNELITEYIWIAYLESLQPGAVVDHSMRRGRKQVSSHIQVLKGFLKGHPACEYINYHHLLKILIPVDPFLFPHKKGPKNGFEDSFKDDPCLKALSEGRLPGKRYNRTCGANSSTKSPSIKPAQFLLVLKADGDGKEEDLCDNELLHEFSRLSIQSRNRTPLESIPYWRERFPLLHQIQCQETINCEIIHMNVSLNLLSSPPSQSSQLLSRTVVSIAGGDSGSCEWRIVTTLKKPQELCSGAYNDGRLKDPPIDQEPIFVEVGSITETETLVNVPFPAAQFAYVFSCLISLKGQYEEQLRGQSFRRRLASSIRPVHEYVEQISMFQELQSRPAPGLPFVTRAIFMWTFHEAREGETNHTVWNYLDPSPPRRTVMSPSPHLSQQASAIMNENYHNWAETPMLMQHTNVLDSYSQGLVTPPQTAGLQSPFEVNGYSFPQLSYGLQAENLSFMSTATLDSDSTLVSDPTANLESFLSNGPPGLANYEHNEHNWELPVNETFETDPAWASYVAPASTSGVVWDMDTKTTDWPELPVDNHLEWVDGSSPKNSNQWPGIGSSPGKTLASYVDDKLEQKLMPWLPEHHEGDVATHDEYSEISDARIAAVAEMDMNIALHETGGFNTQQHKSIDALPEETGWHLEVEDGFDYAQLAAKLKA